MENCAVNKVEKKDSLLEMEIIKRGKYYIEYYKDNVYAYKVFDIGGDLIEEYQNITGSLIIEEIHDELLHVRIGAGTYSYTDYFFDCKKGVVSEFFSNVLAISDRKIVYMKEFDDGRPILVVRDAFDKDIFYKEIMRDFSPVVSLATVIVSAEFIDDDSLQIEYFTGIEYDTLIEIIEV